MRCAKICSPNSHQSCPLADALSPLTALSPLDGRYRAKVAALSQYFSEYGLIRERIRVELAWLQALSDEPAIVELKPFSERRARGAC